MDAKNFNVKALVSMAHSPVRNYAIPGLTSWLIGEPSKHGTVRMFECSREHQEPITPHSHRFDFQCWVLAGSVRNRVWYSTYPHDPAGDFYQQSRLHYEGGIGKYTVHPMGPAKWCYSDRTYAEGQCYAMEAREIHSIYFARGTRVLFFEGPQESDTSVILEPWVDGETVPTLTVEPWMFKRTPASSEAVRGTTASATAEMDTPCQ